MGKSTTNGVFSIAMLHYQRAFDIFFCSGGKGLIRFARVYEFMMDIPNTKRYVICVGIGSHIVIIHVYTGKLQGTC